ncbi:MAG: hypothetical protein BZ137_01455 [Methanosphaera sp. rholeuAM130]|nr:MAG: hypothetical protein BZ137_01455 [Methanosphaera sp. rholeuAM130]
MDYIFLLIIFIYLLAWYLGPVITKKLGISNKVYLNKSFNRLKAKYLAYMIIFFTILVLLLDFNSLMGVELYYTMIPIISLVFFAVLLIFRNDFLNLRYSSDGDDDKYYLDFVNVSFIPIIIIALLSNLLRINNNLLVILVMVVTFVEMIILIFSLFPDKVHEYFITRNYSFSYKQYFMIILVVSLIPVLILLTILMIL